MRSLTVIQGGRSQPGTAAMPVRGATSRRLDRPRPLGDDAAAAWRALIAGNATDDRQARPALAPRIVHRRAVGDGIASAPGRVEEAGTVQLRRGPGPQHPAAALIDGIRADAASSGRLPGLRRPLRAAGSVRGETLRPVTTRCGRRAIPADCVIGVRPADDAAHAIRPGSDPIRLAAVVEAVPVTDLRPSAPPVAAPPDAVAPAPVATATATARRVGRPGGMPMALARRAGAAVAGLCAMVRRCAARA